MSVRLSDSKLCYLDLFLWGMHCLRHFKLNWIQLWRLWGWEQTTVALGDTGLNGLADPFQIQFLWFTCLSPLMCTEETQTGSPKNLQSQAAYFEAKNIQWITLTKIKFIFCYMKYAFLLFFQEYSSKSLYSNQLEGCAAICISSYMFFNTYLGLILY